MKKKYIKDNKSLKKSKKNNKSTTRNKLIELSIFFMVIILFLIAIQIILKKNPFLNTSKIFKANNNNDGRVFLCKTYNNEQEMAYIHIWRLYDYVDKFIIIVSNISYSLQTKNVTFDIFEKELKQYKDKIDIVYFDNVCNRDLYPGTDLIWCMEKCQRDYSKIYIESKYNPTQKDLLIIVDMDEILTREGIQYIKKHPPDTFKYIFGAVYFPYYNHKLDNFSRIIVLRYNKTVKSISSFRWTEIKDSEVMKYDYNPSKPLATHYWYCFKSIEEYKNKLKSFAHTEFNKEPYITNDWIFKSHYCREKINSPKGYDEPTNEGWKDLIPNDERLKFLVDRSFMYNVSQTNYTKKDLETLCDRKFNRDP